MMPDQHRVVRFTRLVGKDIQPLQSVKLIYQPCSRSRVALDPHMIIELEDGLKSWFMLLLPYAYGVSYLSLILMWDGIYLYLLVNSA